MGKKHTETIIKERAKYLEAEVLLLKGSMSSSIILKECEIELAELKQIITACNNHYSLLEALKEVVRISDRKHDAWDKAKEAIKNCEGK